MGTNLEGTPHTLAAIWWDLSGCVPGEEALREACVSALVGDV